MLDVNDAALLVVGLVMVFAGLTTMSYVALNWWLGPVEKDQQR